jgi:NAD(P)-dependent dehydrogenase (short-subunit alcohol dehydrogenase family)
VPRYGDLKIQPRPGYSRSFWQSYLYYWRSGFLFQLFRQRTNVPQGTAGLGKESALTLAKHNPAHIYLAGRDSKRGTGVVDDIEKSFPNVKATFVACDLASLASVQRGAKQFTSACDRLDILMCNAGVMALPPGLTKDGYEVQFGTNHIGHALLIKLLLPTLLRTAEQPDSAVRIVLNTSLGFRGAPRGGVVFKDLRTTQTCISPVAGNWIRYGQSKLANILYAAELGRRYPSITSVSIHPGVINTGLIGNLSFLNKALVHVTNIGNFLTPEEGIQNQLWAATAKNGDVVNGAFYEPVAVLGTHDRLSKDQNLATQLWDWTEKELEAFKA